MTEHEFTCFSLMYGGGECTCARIRTQNPKPIVKRGSYVRWTITPKGKRELAKIRMARAEADS